MSPFIRKLIVKVQSQLAKRRLERENIVPFQGPPKSGMDKETVLKKVKEVPFWWHSIEVGYGIVTSGHQGGLSYPSSAYQLVKSLKFPENLKGKSFLDIGAWDGYFAFEAEKRGASKVLAFDNFYRDKLEDTGSQGFEVLKEILDSKVEFQKADVYDLSPEKFGMFDVVIFPGVLYHLKHPLLALEKIASVTKEMLILETHYDPYHKGKYPLASFYEKDEVNNDPTTWWGFNEECLHAALRTAGFKNTETVHKYADRIGIKAYK